MKKIVVVLVSLVVGVLIGVGNVFAQDKTPEASIPEPSLSSEWKPVAMSFSLTTFYFNTRKITYLPGGIVKVWELLVPRGETRRKDVNFLKKTFLSEGKDPNDAERLWYKIYLVKVNCKTHQFAPLEDIAYSFRREVLDDESFQHEGWYDIPPGSAIEIVEKRVCNEVPPSTIPAPPTIPEPSLSSKWKLVSRYSDGTTAYVNTRITYSPKGIVKVRGLLVPRGEMRRRVVNILKGILLLKREDPNNAERLWYFIELDKFNCKTHQVAPLEDIYYSFGKVVLDYGSVQHEKWLYIPPGSAGEKLEKYVCK